MAFTGKTTYAAGDGFPELAEDVSDIVSIVSPYETPLLDALGDAAHAATSVRHEWIDAELVPNSGAVDMPGLDDAGGTTVVISVADATRFLAGDVLQAPDYKECMLVASVDAGASTITLQRGYGGTAAAALHDRDVLRIISHAGLEGEDAPPPRYTTRARQFNYTQIFTATLQVSGTEAAVRHVAVEDEVDFQKSCRLREMLRDLENTVINGISNAALPQGSPTVRRTLRGIIASLRTHAFAPGDTGFPEGTALTEEFLNSALRRIWEDAGSKVDLIVCGGAQKRRINGFIATNQRFSAAGETYKSLVSSYESDFGVCRVVLSRFVPTDAVLLLDAGRIDVVPLIGRSFQFQLLAAQGDYHQAELVGEYTLELRNEPAHGMIRGLS